MGPQVTTPEELVTVPVGAAIGSLIGGLIGAGVGMWSGSTVAEVTYEWIFEEGF